ncbi:hypothetical protein [Paramaledivibacter caminithermalis]|jgi:hypothetical protein|uniref:Lipoprotein n=1 Tax=Paramaledivibacter caminithermalis (strain DSM 15212 / CIP 107654 / DViRD3) TaxID=1121301 RepID=A0A1M6U8U4_PARC5|nr:hypothetical protein [Paramaledivibacter caminithermalis]SHK65695.1 hypothetical protein SAMN02745912_03899 [Paramaledivibacter caminithermalis DSM 15212]
MKKVYIFGMLAYFVVALIGCFVYESYFVSKPRPILNGTFVNESNPYNYLVFDKRDNYSFYYIPPDGPKEKGTYYLESDNIYVLNNDKMINVKLFYKKNSFIINIDGIQYKFKRISNQPIIQIFE